MAQSASFCMIARSLARRSLSTGRLHVYTQTRPTAILPMLPLRARIPACVPDFYFHPAYSTSTSVSQPVAESTPSEKLQPPDHLNDKERHIFDKLASQLEPIRLEVQDVSGGCGSMYAIEIASPKFKGLTMMKQHRLVQGILEEEIKGWHGLQLRTKVE